MNNHTFKLIIRTPEATLYEAEVDSVYLGTEGGDLQCFAQHASLTGTIAFSPVIVEQEGKEEHFMVRNGLFLFDNKKNEAVVLALHGEKQSEIKEQTVKEYLQYVEDQLARGEDLTELQVLYLKGEKLAVEQQLS